MVNPARQSRIEENVPNIRKLLSDINTKQEDRIRKAIDDTEKEIINPIRKDILISFILHVGYFMIIFISVIITNIEPTEATILGTLGLGLAGVSADINRLYVSANEMFKDRSKLKRAVAVLRNKLNSAENDTAKLNELQSLIDGIYIIALKSYEDFIKDLDKLFQGS
ncbi:MAG: hypothetical protein ACTSP4_03375 [Candidatus Hodarchaeales archaeon]